MPERFNSPFQAPLMDWAETSKAENIKKKVKSKNVVKQSIKLAFDSVKMEIKIDLMILVF